MARKRFLLRLKHLRGPLAFGYVHDRADILNQPHQKRQTPDGPRDGSVLSIHPDGQPDTRAHRRSLRSKDLFFIASSIGPVLGVNTVDECIIVRHLEQIFPATRLPDLHKGPT